MTPAPSNLKSFTVGFFLSAILGGTFLFACLAVYYPTSYYRTQLTFFLVTGILFLGTGLLLLLVLIGQITAYSTGWRSSTTRWGVSLGALATWLCLYLGLFGPLLWMQDEDVSHWGQASRVVLAILVSAGTLRLAYQFRPRGPSGTSLHPSSAS